MHCLLRSNENCTKPLNLNGGYEHFENGNAAISFTGALQIPVSMPASLIMVVGDHWKYAHQPNSNLNVGTMGIKPLEDANQPISNLNLQSDLNLFDFKIQFYCIKVCVHMCKRLLDLRIKFY